MFEINYDFLEDDFIKEEVIVDEQRHLLLATATQIELLGRSRRWFLDGTFKLVKKPFVQLWSIHAFIHKDDDIKQVPLVFVLMTRRTQADYIAILRATLNLIDPVLPEVAVLDFEMALWQALRTVIPDITLKGCIFHWSQCLWRKIQNLGLQPTYTERQGPFIFMRKLMALPFLPAAHIDAAFRAIRERANTPQLVELTNYIAEQWMESQVYPMSSLSVYNYVIRTNNDVEGWHCRMNSRANGQGLAFYTLVPYLRKEAEPSTQATSS